LGAYINVLDLSTPPSVNKRATIYIKYVDAILIVYSNKSSITLQLKSTCRPSWLVRLGLTSDSSVLHQQQMLQKPEISYQHL